MHLHVHVVDLGGNRVVDREELVELDAVGDVVEEGEGLRVDADVEGVRVIERDDAGRESRVVGDRPRVGARIRSPVLDDRLPDVQLLLRAAGSHALEDAESKGAGTNGIGRSDALEVGDEDVRDPRHHGAAS